LKIIDSRSPAFEGVKSDQKGSFNESYKFDLL
jgi:hypothetical protein